MRAVMNSFQTTYRVTYSDTDQMGFMHHSNYLKCYETARWELFRSVGIPYHEIEKDGIILPVIDAFLKYIIPAYYDQTIAIETRVKQLKGARIIFDFVTKREDGVTINEAQITVAFVRKSTGNACPPPKKVADTLKDLIDK